jgi:hypothetical protein
MGHSVTQLVVLLSPYVYRGQLAMQNLVLGSANPVKQSGTHFCVLFSLYVMFGVLGQTTTHLLVESSAKVLIIPRGQW